MSLCSVQLHHGITHSSGTRFNVGLNIVNHHALIHDQSTQITKYFIHLNNTLLQVCNRLFTLLDQFCSVLYLVIEESGLIR